MSKTDPTRTTRLRRSFMAAMKKRFLKLKRSIQEALIKKDVMGMLRESPMTFNYDLSEREFEFRANPDKLAGFNAWFKSQIEEGVLEVSGNQGLPWTETFVESAYRKGVVRAFIDSKGNRLLEPSILQGSQAEFLRSMFSQPERISKLRLLGLRAFEDLQGIGNHTSLQMSRILGAGLGDGLGIRAISRLMSREIDTITRTRAMTLARTEIIHAHAEGQLDSFEELGVEELGVDVEWSTTGDDKVCELCQELEATTYTLQEARGLLPRHPNCRCAWIPGEIIPKAKKRKSRIIGNSRRKLNKLRKPRPGRCC